ncbi:MAG: glycosyltransferase family 2 protein [Acidobacteria bacterium]|nr:glycosyltransferase family 2 protein [Acidobacteriota bacterium]
MDTEAPVTISIVVACRNEARHIGSLLESLLAQDFGGMTWEAIVADGESDDSTREILEEFRTRDPRICVIANPGRIVSTGLNAAIHAARGDFILRMDAHTRYAPDYCLRCVETLQNTGADNAGGPARTAPQGAWGHAIAAAYHSRFSTGGGKFHREDVEGWVDTVPYGCWRRTIFSRIGLFDETLVRNQDDEFNLRLLRAGGRIWQSPRIVSWYSPRASLRALFRQYFQYGFWKVAVIRKHRIPASWRHLVPGGFVAANIALAAGATVGVEWCAELWLVMAGTYVIASVAASVIVARQNGWRPLPYLPLIFLTYHLSYGAGFLAGMASMWLGRNRMTASPLFTRLSR